MQAIVLSLEMSFPRKFDLIFWSKPSTLTLLCKNGYIFIPMRFIMSPINFLMIFTCFSFSSTVLSNHKLKTKCNKRDAIICTLKVFLCSSLHSLSALFYCTPYEIFLPLFEVPFHSLPVTLYQQQSGSN